METMIQEKGKSDVPLKRRLQIGKHTFSLGARTLIMGVVNVTPDSFSDRGRFFDPEKAVAHAKKLIAEGADILDIGAESTRPEAQSIDAQTELDRLMPVLERLLSEPLPVPLSIDTYKAEVAREALVRGAHMINDVGGLQRDPAMSAVVAEFQVPVVILHHQEPAAIQGDRLEALLRFFRRAIQIARKAGIDPDKIIVDPGIGFGKTYEDNIEILSHLERLKALGYPLLLGTSRKSVIGHILKVPPQERLEGTLSTNIIGIVKGVDIIRVHDVGPHRRAAAVADRILRGSDG